MTDFLRSTFSHITILRSNDTQKQLQQHSSYSRGLWHTIRHYQRISAELQRGGVVSNIDRGSVELEAQVSTEISFNCRPHLTRDHFSRPRTSPSRILMASSVVDRKFLGTLAKEVEDENPLLASTLYKLLGLSNQLSEHLVKARKQRRQLEAVESAGGATQQRHYNHIIWLAREGLVMLEGYVLPMVTNSGVLKVLAFKLRASLYHIIVLFHNQPPVSAARWGSTPEIGTLSTPGRQDKGKGVAREEPDDFYESPLRPLYEGGPVAPPPGFEQQKRSLNEPPASFLLPAGDYLPTAHRYFKEALALADKSLWGSHSLRLSIRTEYSAFLYECVHDEDASRRVARKTINEVYEATEGIDNDMFQDACELVTVLGRMMRRGQQQQQQQQQQHLQTATSRSGKESASPATTVRRDDSGSRQDENQDVKGQDTTPTLATGAIPPAQTPRTHLGVEPASSIRSGSGSTVRPMPPASEAQPGFI